MMSDLILPNKRTSHSTEVPSKHSVSTLDEDRKKQLLSKALLTRDDICFILHLSYPTLHKHINAGMPSLKIGRKRMFKYELVEKYWQEKNQKMKRLQ
jgi:excisionase family DNA binding protein